MEQNKTKNDAVIVWRSHTIEKKIDVCESPGKCQWYVLYSDIEMLAQNNVASEKMNETWCETAREKL